MLEPQSPTKTAGKPSAASARKGRKPPHAVSGPEAEARVKLTENEHNGGRNKLPSLRNSSEASEPRLDVSAAPQVQARRGQSSNAGAVSHRKTSARIS